MNSLSLSEPDGSSSISYSCSHGALALDLLPKSDPGRDLLPKSEPWRDPPDFFLGVL